MRGKGSRTKASLQKTASSVINIHTHRNSHISDIIPLYYNDSLVSIRNNSVSKHRKCFSINKLPQDKKKDERSKKRKQSS